MMKKWTQFSLSFFLALGILLLQAGGVFAAPALQDSGPVSGVIQSIMLEANTVTGVTLVSIDVLDGEQTLQSVRVSLETAIQQGLVVLNGDGKPVINDSALGKPIEIDPSNIIPTRQENQHPIGSALATFFSEIPGIDYETIMSAHDQGVGFGVIAQTLWLTTKLKGDAQIFEALLEAKQTGDFSAFILEDGTTPENWGQLKKAILAKDKENGLGIVISDSNHPANGNTNNENNGNNGNGGGNGNGNGNGNGGGNGNGNGNGKGNDKGGGNGNGNGKDKK
jgi:hypothetical protein